jgi:tRNA threonylcarbamoyladenosine biosynthesis protein TsaB
MKTLAVDTALGACSAAILADDQVLARRFERMDKGHAERLAPMVQEVMHEAGIAFAALDRLAVTTGPGTFTGQRVGLAFMRGLRLALKKPLVGITTLEAMLAEVMGLQDATASAVAQHAKRNEAYCAGRIGERLVIPVSLVALEELPALMRNTFGGQNVAVAGTAADVAAEACGCTAQIVDVVAPDAIWVARLARSVREEQTAPKPLYLRPPDAHLPTKVPE